MKLKDRPLEWWKGRKFAQWYGADKTDARAINITVHHRSIGQGLRVFHFKAEDVLYGIEFDDPMFMYWVETGRINEITLKDNEWFVTIDAGIIPVKRKSK